MDTLKIFIARQIYELYNITFELALKLNVSESRKKEMCL